MPSMLHEILVDLIRKNPELLVPLLEDKLGAVDLRGGRFGPDERNFGQLVDLTADLVLQVHDRSGQLLCALIPEVQLSPHRKKKYTWPSYQASTFRRLECPTFVVVIAIKPGVARWADETIWTGQTHFRPIVIGPKQLPLILDPRHARDNVALAVLSGLAHSKGPEAEQIGVALWQALDQRSEGQSEGRAHRQPDPRHDLYWDQFLALIDETTRKNLMIQLGSYQPQSEWGKQIYAEGESKGLLEGERKGLVEGERKGLVEGERKGLVEGERKGLVEGERKGLVEGERKGLVEGERKGQAAALTMLLQARGLSPNSTVRDRIEQCRNVKTLHQWLRRAATAVHLDEVFES